MVTPAVFLATHHLTFPSSCRVFDRAKPSTAETSRRVRAHLLHPWSVRARVFEDEDTVNLWATEVIDCSAPAGDPASSSPSAFADSP